MRPALFVVLSLVLATASGAQPNIVLIVADALGWRDVGYNGSEIATPNIDALANNGVKLTDFHVHVTCSPTRAALMTGQSPMRHVIYPALGRNTEASLPRSLKLLPEYLRDAGYQSVMFGRPLPTDFLEFLRHNTEDGGADNGPYRRGKGAVYEGGLLVPSVLHWPAGLRPATVPARVTVQDVLPTLAEVAGVALPPSIVLDGEARWTAIRGESMPSRSVFVAVNREERAVLEGDRKLIISGDAMELYNLAEDPVEALDRAAQEPERIERMLALIAGIPQQPSINQPLIRLMMDMDRFGGEEDRPPWAAVVRQAP